VHTKETGNGNIAAASKNFCQTGLNTWNWIVLRTPRKLQRHSQKTKQLCFQETERAILLKSCIAQWLFSFLCVIFCLNCSDGTEVDEATDVFVLLNEQKPSLYDKIHLEGQSGFDVGKNFT
jgi:hypothetical protein